MTSTSDRSTSTAGGVISQAGEKGEGAGGGGGEEGAAAGEEGPDLPGGAPPAADGRGEQHVDCALHLFAGEGGGALHDGVDDHQDRDRLAEELGGDEALRRRVGLDAEELLERLR